jgi:uncharacterized protein YhfF
MRLTFPYDRLLDQVLDGRKTASVLRPGERNYGTDPRDAEVRVGGEYDACDTRGDVRCRIRVTDMRELRWGEPIPEALWRAEACASEEEFRRDHLEWFARPSPEYTFRAFWFERIAAVLLAMLLGTTSGALSARADEPRVALPHDARPRLANDHDVAAAIMRPMMETGFVAEGTVYVGVALTPEGVAVPVETYGGLAANAEFARVLRQAVEKARFVVPAAWSAANPRRSWAMFWAFRADDCRAWSYDAPANVTVVRICVPARDGKIAAGGASYLVDANVPGLDLRPQPRPEPGRVIPYPRNARRKRAEGYVAMRLTLDEGGRVAALDVLEDTAGSDFRDWLDDWRSNARFRIPAGWPAAGEPRTLDVRVAFGIAPRGAGAECAWVLPMFAGIELRVCTGGDAGR